MAIACSTAHAGTPAPGQSATPAALSRRVGVVDARMPDAAHIALDEATGSGTPPGDGAPLPELHFLRLSPPPGKAAECCIRPLAPIPPQQAGILRYDGEDAQPASESEARFTKAPGDGFVGLALDGKPSVKRISSHRLLLRWPDSKAPLRVDHCLSAEGLHVKISESTGAGRWKPAGHYYIPLGADVQANCPAE